jgi:hypothetical protein
MPKTKSAIELLRAANQGAVMETVFEIPAGDGTTIKARLTAPDAMQIWQESDLEQRAIWVRAEALGLVGKPINQKEWDEELDRMSLENRKLAEANPPKDQAEQCARKHGGMNVMRTIIPKYLQDVKGNYLFPTKQEQDDFVKIMFYNSSIMQTVMNAYAELSQRIQEAKSSIKN